MQALQGISQPRCGMPIEFRIVCSHCCALRIPAFDRPLWRCVVCDIPVAPKMLFLSRESGFGADMFVYYFLVGFDAFCTDLFRVVLIAL